MTATPIAPTAGGTEAAPQRPSLVARALLWLIRAYQLLRGNRVSPCRFTPSCSEYAHQAVALHGAGHGTALTLRRLARCRPGGPFGPDPVPERG